MMCLTIELIFNVSTIRLPKFLNLLPYSSGYYDDGSNEVSVHINSGTGSFGTATNYTVADARELSIVDYNGDGDMDIVAVSYSGGYAQVLENGGSGTFTSGQTFELGSIPVNQSVADLDEDGHQDFVTVNRTANSISINYGTDFVEVTCEALGYHNEPLPFTTSKHVAMDLSRVQSKI